MKIVETYGLYHYEVEGENEEAAAKELDEGYDFIMSPATSHMTSEERLIELHDLRKSIENKYNVTIKIV